MKNWRYELKAFRHALSGLKVTFLLEKHMRFHAFATVIVLLLGRQLHVVRHDWLWLALAITLVWVTELINTAVENVVDLISPELHPYAKIAKDTCAGAVLTATCFALLVGIIVLGPPLWRLFF